MSNLDLNQDTVRQRRNLVVVAVLLIFVSHAEVTFGNTVNFLGAALTVGKPEKIHQGLILFLGYFLWRFYQYFTTDNAYTELCNQFKTHMHRTESTKIVQAICKPRGITSLQDAYTYKDLKHDSLLTYSIEAVEIKGFDPVLGASEENRFKAEISAINLEIWRLLAVFSFIFRARILTDYFVPYFLVVYATYLQFV